MATYDQVSLFDPVAAHAAKEEALERVEDNADRRWFLAALKAVYELSLGDDRFSTDHVWQALVASPESTHEPRAMGAVMNAARKRGWCQPTKQYDPSARPACNGRPIRLWEGATYIPHWEPAMESKP